MKNCFDRTPHTMKDWLLLAAGVAAVFAAADWLPGVLRGAGAFLGLLAPFGWGLLLAYVLDIPTRFFAQKLFGGRRGGAMAVSYALFFGALALLAALGCDTLAFGAETPDAAALLDAAQLLLNGEINALIRKKLATGMTYAAARADAAETLRPGMGTLLRTPNNILGIEYCKAILAQGAALTPLALPRLGAAHGGGAGEHGGTPMASASYLRGLPLPEWTAFVPAGAAALYAKAAAEGLLLDSAKFEVAVLTQLRMQPPENFAQLRGISEGLENRLAASVRQADGLDDLYTRLKTKRYPHARLRRLVLDAALQFPAELPMPPYLHVLGAKKSALPRLKYAALPAGTALAELVQIGPQAAEIGRLHSRAVDFSSLCREKIQPMGLAFTAKPVVI